jgi:hypothetical protein
MVSSMRSGLFGVAALVMSLGSLGGCVGPTVDVTPVGPAPRVLAPRAPEMVKRFELRPDNGIEVFDLEAYGDAKPKLLVAIRQKAASLGCDGLMFTAPSAANLDNTAATGQLNEHHQKPGSHIEAVCIVLQAAAAAETAQ